MKATTATKTNRANGIGVALPQQRHGEARKVPKWKVEEVSDIKKLTTTYRTIAVFNLENLPTDLLQIVKKKLRDKINIKISKKRLIKRAFNESANVNIKNLMDNLDGAPALIFTNMGAFELFKTLKANKQFVPAQPGQIAPEDIWVHAGPTPFTPGPIISELASLKIKAGVEAGKIAIKADSLVVKKGEKFSSLAAGILAKLDIRPMKVGMDVVAVLEEGDLYKAHVLDIDEEQLILNIKTAAMDAFALAVNLGIANKETISYLVGKAHADALAVSRGLIPKGTSEVIAEAESAANALKDKIKE